MNKKVKVALHDPQQIAEYYKAQEMQKIAT